IIAAAGGDIAGKTVAVLGLSFKPETDDMRDSPSLDILPALFDAGAAVRAYDPKAMDEARALLPEETLFADSAMTCLQGADVAVIVTEWNEFRALTPAHFLDAMRGDVLVDLRNIYRPEDMRAAGLSYHSVGRK
ncbi:MAG: UDP binding domain-containing protein, partial [Pseudomonadota bacterium]|nr:UDP binding domain-containing protein [Pseudomonadota bacterium]